MTITAKYEDGVFKPLQHVAIQDGAVVELTIPSTPASKPRSIRDLGFVGMWADRGDIEDGVDFVDRIRDAPRA